MSQKRLLAILLSVVAGLVLVVGGLSAFLLLSDDGTSGGGGSGVTTQGGDGGGGGAVVQAASGRIRLASGDPVTLDPHLAGDALSAEYIVEIFGGLLTLGRNMDIELDLAESVEVSDDGLIYTFVLRDDARFHSGRIVTAEDVVYSIQRAGSRQLSSPTALAYLGDIIGMREYYFGIA
ncbi:MAG: ABC transporter substrate-binding protein, partial [Dehalococcoidia bacterium]